MTTLTPTKDTGSTAKANNVAYAEPASTITDETLTADVHAEGLNRPFIADLLSAYLTHERCGVHLYRSVAGRTLNTGLKARYQNFGRQTERHVEILEAVITTAGGNPNYISPLARAVEAADSSLLQSTFLTSGTADPAVREMSMLDAVFIAETINHANWETLRALAQQLPDNETKTTLNDAIAEIEAQEDDHYTWTRDTRALLTLEQASMAEPDTTPTGVLTMVEEWDLNGSPTSSRASDKLAELEAMTRDELYTLAQDQGLEGRSDMTKDQLIAALQDHT